MHSIGFTKRRDLPSVDEEQFKLALRHFASGVTVVTAELDGERYGITVSAFASISLEPPIVMVSINNASQLARMIVESEHFAVHILASDQEAVSALFAASISGSEKYGELSVELGPSGAPMFSGSLAVIDCVLDQTLAVGTHTLMFGRVVHSRAVDDAGAPLIYYHRRYWTVNDGESHRGS
jgi:flavin reductase (DIM6/NTAB) family NADH-FMN oxidoreductase RutF